MSKWQKYSGEAISALLILLFVYAAISKLTNYLTWVKSLAKAPLIHSNSNIVAIIVPLIEIFIAGLFFFPKQRKKGFVLSTFLMLSFTIYIAYMLLFVSHLPCSCGGVLQSMGWRSHLIFNCFFTLLSGLGWIMESRNNTAQLKFLLQ